ncbi:MAG TPA: MarR family transcriptional regulator [Fibrobacteria bacterium]|nr:MarR family transcriptional regulator [Fibrobacteria bacterium]
MDSKVNPVDHSRTDELNQALELFHFAYRAFTAGPDRILESRGLQRVHHRILYFVGRNPDLSVNGLLGILGVSKQALNAPLRQLLEMRLVDNQLDPQDRRIRRLRLTADGAKLETSLSGQQRRAMDRIFQRSGPGAEQAWRDVMAAIGEERS